MYWPQVSSRKRIEVELRKDGKLTPSLPRGRIDHQQDRASVDLGNGEGNWISSAREESNQRGSPKKRKVNWRSHNSMVPALPEPK